MSLIWRECDNGWEAAPSRDGRIDGSDLGEDGVRLLGFGQGAERGVVLLAALGSWVRVNGQPVLGGLRILEHKDEILLGQGRRRFYYSSERKPVVVPFALVGGERLPTCPVCRGPIKEGELAVCCPGCARWHHQSDGSDGGKAKACWTYNPTCRFDNHPTDLDGGPVWRPELEECHAA